MVTDLAAVDDSLTIQRFAINDEFSPKPGAAPERARRYHTLVSVDDHLVEPPHLFKGRMPAKFADRTPRVIEMTGGAHAWVFDGSVISQIAINAVVDKSVEQQFVEPTRFDELRPATWDIDARIADMDTDGVYASLNFPSALGFAGVRLTTLPDRDFALAVTRAWNQWHLEEWAGRHPGRIIPCQIVFLTDVEAAAAEVLANAERGFHALTFPESPQRVGLPSLHSGYWDPLWAACCDTGTVVCIHAGSGGLSSLVDPAAPQGVLGPMFAISQCLNTAIDWLYSRISIKFPEIRICLSEGGIGWIPALLDRLDHGAKTRQYEGVWTGTDLTPSELLLRNFWFCMLDDPTTLRSARHRIGVGHIMMETDYPHSDSSWPNSQEKWRAQFEGLPKEEVDLMAWGNAAELFSHPVPPEIRADPDAF